MNRKINIAVYGSCITKDPFTTVFNSDYKQRYNCLINDQKHSLISTMQKKENVDESLLQILPDNPDNRFLTRCIKEDLEKTFITLLNEYDIDYLVFDIYFDVERGIIKYNDNKILTRITGFEQTDYYKTLKNIETLSMTENPVKYFELWKEYCKKFFEYLREHSPKTKIILAEVRSLNTVRRADGSTYTEPNYNIKTKINNRYYKQLEDYIKANYDVKTIKFDKDIILEGNHKWGKYHVHYTDEYYTNFLKKVDDIIEQDRLEEEVQKLRKENKELKQQIKELEKQSNNHTL
ncbi:DUF6270 domain-containing protein [Methanosphaera sp. ISO3-F5]|uniref:DUF6270 domain-containing protein n=1 Tax=Methanosphaera sp. ISO3-F5 TaxID=1452353 RepID=UPI002B258611|nr:DUF6270 domain-containing protein [Methanosphaera sp. ISO3-F5]WQH63458.1 DUF6270 domain-containing protein [Methanosphaera sp. ISO3-F5]